MRKAITLLVIAVATVLLCILVLPAQADPQPSVTPSRSYEPPAAYDYVSVEAEHSAGANAIMRALTDWSPHSSTRPSAESMQPWADAMGDVCMSRDECIHMAALAFEESGFVPWALDQSCNDVAWRAAQVGWMRKACDNGFAFGPWQVHNSRFAGASPEFQASVVLELMRHYPQGWTTWGRAHALAERWLATHP